MSKGESQHMQHFKYYPGFSNVFKRAVRRHGSRKHIQEEVGDLGELEQGEETHYASEASGSSSDEPNSAENGNNDSEDDPMDATSGDVDLSARLHAMRREWAFTYKILRSELDNPRTPYDFYVMLLEPKLIEFCQSVEFLREACDVADGYYQIDLDSLYPNIRDLRSNFEEGPAAYKSLVNLVETLFSDQYITMDRDIEAGTIPFGALWYYFDRTDSLFSVKAWHSHRYLYRHKSYCYAHSMRGGTAFQVTGTLTGYNVNGERAPFTFSHVIPSFNGKKQIDSLPFLLVEDEGEIAAFRARGLRTDELFQQARENRGVQMHLSGVQTFSGGSGAVKIYRDQRVMLSTEHKQEDLFNDLLPIEASSDTNAEGANSLAYTTLATLLSAIDDSGASESHVSPEKQNEEEDGATILPFLPVYNLGATKTWGIAHVSDLREVNYMHSFDTLVMAEERKNMIQNLVTYHQKELDNISGDIDQELTKNKGLLMMLHGPPGVGKTLTAETCADHLKRPLYIVSSADISLETGRIEHTLAEIQRLCHQWKAIILLDEADVFLEARDLHNLHRNAICACFLRFLEYTNNIIFLTTNRLRTLDDAIQSRVHLILKFNPLAEADRKIIWKAVLNDMGVDAESDEMRRLVENHLAPLEMNGREIHNSARTAISSLAQETEGGISALTPKQVRTRVKYIQKVNGEYENREATANLYM